MYLIILEIQDAVQKVYVIDIYHKTLNALLSGFTWVHL